MYDSLIGFLRITITSAFFLLTNLWRIFLFIFQSSWGWSRSWLDAFVIVWRPSYENTFGNPDKCRTNESVSPSHKKTENHHTLPVIDWIIISIELVVAFSHLHSLLYHCKRYDRLLSFFFSVSAAKNRIVTLQDAWIASESRCARFRLACRRARNRNSRVLSLEEILHWRQTNCASDDVFLSKFFFGANLGS